MLFTSLQAAIASKLQARAWFNSVPLVKIVEEDHENLKTEVDKSLARLGVLGIVAVTDITSDDGENVECQVTVQICEYVNLQKKIDRKRSLDCVVEVLGALKGWQPADCWTPLRHTGSHYKGVMELGCVVWEVTFTTRTFLNIEEEEGDYQLCDVLFSSTPATGGCLMTLTCATPNAAILFTTTSNPTHTLWTAPVFLAYSDAVEAAAHTDYGYSAVFTRAAANYVAPVQFTSTPAEGGYMMTLACPTPGSYILFTIQGQEPTPTQWTAPVFIASADTVEARAYTNVPGGEGTLGISNLLIICPGGEVVDDVQYSLTPAEGGHMLTLTCATPATYILFTIRGGEPTPTQWTAPVFISSAETVEATAYTTTGHSAPLTIPPQS